MSFDPESTDTKKFQDPLENYDPPVIVDPIERALREQLVTAIQTQPYASISPETTVGAALKRLASEHISCLLIEQDRRLVGVFSDRDFLSRVALEYEKLVDEPVQRVMTSNPVFVYETDSAAAALCVMAVSGFRHVPVVDLEQKPVGIISPQRVTQFLREFSKRD